MSGTSRRDLLKGAAMLPLAAQVKAPAAKSAAASRPMVVSSANGLKAVEKAYAVLASGGDPLDAVISGVTPTARFWTLTLYNVDGELVANSINRSGFTSQEIVRHADGSFEVAIAPRANPGNWLPTGGVERYVLLLRLYDTAVGVSTKAGREAPMPAINVRSCP